MRHLRYSRTNCGTWASSSGIPSFSAVKVSTRSVVRSSGISEPEKIFCWHRANVVCLSSLGHSDALANSHQFSPALVVFRSCSRNLNSIARSECLECWGGSSTFAASGEQNKTANCPPERREDPICEEHIYCSPDLTDLSSPPPPFPQWWYRPGPKASAGTMRTDGWRPPSATN